MITTSNFINQFVINHESGINTIFKIKAKDYYSSVDEFVKELEPELQAEYDKLSNQHLNADEINAQLFYLINDFCKPKQKSSKKDKQYLCPGCLFFGNKQVLVENNYLICEVCQHKLNTSQNNQDVLFYKTFAKHNSVGYRCSDCFRFIPKPNATAPNIVCPYFDCLFVGGVEHLKKMHHPSLKENELPDTLIATTLVQQSLESNHISYIKEIINHQLNNLVYTSFNFTLKHKVLVYQSFLSLLDQYPQEMSDYLLHQSRSGGFQHKVFQKYISLLEESFPFVIKKNKTVIRVDGLLDPNLHIFDGISIFESRVEKLSIKNNTQEYYIGGRSAAYSKPYYIGKLLNVIHRDTKVSLMDKVSEYSFSKIKLHDIDDMTPVIVTHLRIPPHYQMGGMVYVNRIRKKIVEELTR